MVSVFVSTFIGLAILGFIGFALTYVINHFDVPGISRFEVSQDPDLAREPNKTKTNKTE